MLYLFISCGIQKEISKKRLDDKTWQEAYAQLLLTQKAKVLVCHEDILELETTDFLFKLENQQDSVILWKKTDSVELKFVNAVSLEIGKYQYQQKEGKKDVHIYLGDSVCSYAIVSLDYKKDISVLWNFFRTNENSKSDKDKLQFPLHFLKSTLEEDTLNNNKELCDDLMNNKKLLSKESLDKVENYLHYANTLDTLKKVTEKKFEPRDSSIISIPIDNKLSSKQKKRIKNEIDRLERLIRKAEIERDSWKALERGVDFLKDYDMSEALSKLDTTLFDIQYYRDKVVKKQKELKKK